MTPQGIVLLIGVVLAVIIATAVLAQVYTIGGQSGFSCPTAGTGETQLQSNIRKGCETFNNFGGLVIVLLPIIVGAGVVFALFRMGWF